MNSLPGVRTCVTSTRAALAGLSVDASGEVSFATSSERDTLAFRLYESDARGGALRPLTGASIPARGRASIGPNVYSTPTAPLERPFVVVEEIETSGHRRRLGPFAADDETLRAGFAAAEERLHREHSGRRAALEAGAASGLAGRGRVAPIRGTPARAVTQIKVTTRGAGPVTIDAADLLALGVDPRVLKSRSLRAFNLGRAIPLEVLRSANRELVGVSFVAEPLLTDFTDENAYVLTFAPHPPPAPAVPFTRSGTPLEPGALRVEQDSFYVPWVPMAADPWLWGVVFQDVAPAEFSFDLPGLTAPDEDVAVRVGLVGATDGEHEVEVSLNGQPLGAVHFSGKAIAEVRGLVPAGALGPSGNALRLQYSSDDPSGFALLDALDLGVVAQLAAPAEVLRMEPYDTGVAALGRADYLIVAPAEFQEAALKLARAKGVLGRRARVVEIERAFDRYAAGVFEAKAIAALLREARRLSPGLRDVLLLGDDTFDPRGHLGLGLASRVPSLVGFDGQFGRVPSETAYADTDGDGAPDVAIGRLPAASADEADRLVEKVVRQRELLRPGKARHVLAVDDEGSADLNFRRLADGVAGTLPPGSTPIFADISAGVAAARATLLQSLRDGAAAVHYFGHGANDFWADERLLDIPALQALAGSGRASLALSWTCEADWYQYHLGQSLGEALLFVPDGGAVAAFGPSGITNPRAQAVFHRRLYPLLLKGIPVGEAVRRAKAAVAREEPWALPVLAGFNLLGDPALVLP